MFESITFNCQVIVVSDGSNDQTAIRAKEAGAIVVELKENVGKGGAMKEGTAILMLIFFCSLMQT